METAVSSIPYVVVLVLHAVLWLACIIGVILSCLSFTGTWLISVAAILAAWLSGPQFPGWITVICFLALSGITEVVEFLAGNWGVARKGGSKAAGIAAVIGGMLGMFLGAIVIPIPVVGSIIGVCIGSFGLSYLVERRHMRTHKEALNVASGAVLARVAVIVFKVAAAIITSIVLLGGLYLDIIR